jgi:hypothetical protein
MCGEGIYLEKVAILSERESTVKPCTFEDDSSPVALGTRSYIKSVLDEMQIDMPIVQLGSPRISAWSFCTL